MRPDIEPGGVFPDYELPDHTNVTRKLSELQGDDPLILTLSRGHYCPKEHQQHQQLAGWSKWSPKRVLDEMSRERHAPCEPHSTRVTATLLTGSTCAASRPTSLTNAAAHVAAGPRATQARSSGGSTSS